MGSSGKYPGHRFHCRLEHGGFGNAGRVVEGLALKGSRDMTLVDEVDQDGTQGPVVNVPGEAGLNLGRLHFAVFPKYPQRLQFVLV